MNRIPPGFYAEWRGRRLVGPTLHEGDASPAPAERLLHAVWHHQRLLREQLRLLDGRPIRILHPGFPNHEAGPDFRGAVLQFDLYSPQAGDVEIDLQSFHWRAHGHQQNPAFHNVLLHVVWEEDRPSKAQMPTLALKPVLDASLADLTLWLGSDAGRDWPSQLAGQCCSHLGKMNNPDLQELLNQAARSRLEAKASHFQARARHVGLEPSLWEGLFRALGYKQNVWPMLRVAELLPRWLAGDGGQAIPLFIWQARLLGISGLLPIDTPLAASDSGQYVRRVWDYWWRERDAWRDHALPRVLWHFHNLRPANHPQRRLALAAHWLASGNLFTRLETWLTSSLADAELVPSLLAILQAAPDDFWSWHWTLRSKKTSQSQPLLGATRISDLAVNVILPWFLMRAVSGKNHRLQQVVEHRFFAWPRAEDNSVLRLARRRLLPQHPARVLRQAAHQQGLLQIVRDYCDHSNAICADCQFPEMLGQLRQA